MEWYVCLDLQNLSHVTIQVDHERKLLFEYDNYIQVSVISMR